MEIKFRHFLRQLFHLFKLLLTDGGNKHGSLNMQTSIAQLVEHLDVCKKDSGSYPPRGGSGKYPFYIKNISFRTLFLTGYYRKHSHFTPKFFKLLLLLFFLIPCKIPLILQEFTSPSQYFTGGYTRSC